MHGLQLESTYTPLLLCVLQKKKKKMAGLGKKTETRTVFTLNFQFSENPLGTRPRLCISAPNKNEKKGPQRPLTHILARLCVLVSPSPRPRPRYCGFLITPRHMLLYLSEIRVPNIKKVFEKRYDAEDAWPINKLKYLRFEGKKESLRSLSGKTNWFRGEGLVPSLGPYNRFVCLGEPQASLQIHSCSCDPLPVVHLKRPDDATRPVTYLRTFIAIASWSAS